MMALWQIGRYMSPFLPLVLLLTVLGVRTLGRAVPAAPQRRAVVVAVLGFAVLIAVVSVPTWALRSAQQGAGIPEAALSPAQWLRGNTPPEARIAVNDVGATAYFSDRTVVDMIGLTTNGLAEPSVEGTGALYEALARMPADQRPTHFSVFIDFMDVDFEDMSAAGVLSEEPLTMFTRSPVRDAALGGVCQSNGGCTQTDVWSADWWWWAAATSRRPRARPHRRPRQRGRPGGRGRTLLRGRPRADRDADRGRSCAGRTAPTGGGWWTRAARSRAATLHVARLTPGVPVTLTTRVEAREPLADRNTQAGVVSVGVGGRPAGDSEFATDDRSWMQDSFVLPAELVTGPEITVTLGPRQPYLQPYPDYRWFSYSASQ